MLLVEELRPEADELPSLTSPGAMVVVAVPTVVAYACALVTTDDIVEPSETVTMVVTYVLVAELTIAEVMIVDFESVERLIVDDPTTTSSEDVRVAEELVVLLATELAEFVVDASLVDESLLVVAAATDAEVDVALGEFAEPVSLVTETEEEELATTSLVDTAESELVVAAAEVVVAASDVSLDPDADVGVVATWFPTVVVAELPSVATVVVVAAPVLNCLFAMIPSGNCIAADDDRRNARHTRKMLRLRSMMRVGRCRFSKG